MTVPSLVLCKHILELLDHVVRQRNCRKTFQSLHVHFLCQNFAISNQLLQIFKVAHKKARCDCVDKDSFFVERVAELVWQANRYGYEVAGAGIEMAASRGMESDFSFLRGYQ
jgi:ribosomal protein L37AE/L43A